MLPSFSVTTDFFVIEKDRQCTAKEGNKSRLEFRCFWPLKQLIIN